MQACKNVSLLLMHLKLGVQKLDLSDIHHADVREQLLVVEGLIYAFQVAYVKTSTGKITSTHLHAEVLQLINRYSGLVDAAVAKLDIIESSAAISCGKSDAGGGSEDGSFHASSTSSSSNDIEFQVFTCLWNLLVTTFVAFRSWPQSWPVRGVAEYAVTQNAAYNLMTFLLRVTHSKKSLWSCMAAKLSPSARIEQARVTLYIPIIYIAAISQMPARSMMQAISALPADYLCTLCCLTLEQLDIPIQSDISLQPTKTTPTAGAKLSCTSTTTSQRLPLPALLAIFNDIVNQAISEGSTSIMSMLVTPAVIQLYKRVLVLVGQQRSNTALLRDEETAVAVLTTLLENSISMHWQVQPCNNLWDWTSLPQQYSAAGITLQPHSGKSSLFASDIQLLQALFTWMPSEPVAAGLRYQLIRTMVQGWVGEPSTYMTLQFATEKEQIRGIFLILHHCCEQSLRFIRRPHERQTAPGLPHSTSSGTFQVGSSQLVPTILVNSTLRAQLRALETDYGAKKALTGELNIFVKLE